MERAEIPAHMKTEAFRIKLEVETKNKLEEYSKIEHRTFASMLDHIVALGIEEYEQHLEAIEEYKKNKPNGN